MDRTGDMKQFMNGVCHNVNDNITRSIILQPKFNRKYLYIKSYIATCGVSANQESECYENEEEIGTDMHARTCITHSAAMKFTC